MIRSLPMMLLILVLLWHHPGIISGQTLRRVDEEESNLWDDFQDYRINGRRPRYRLPADGIVGGVDAAPGEFPWFVSLEYDAQMYCGGSLLSSNRVLSAAHCFFNSAGSLFLPTQVRIGHTNTTDGETRSVSCVSIHPNYTYDLLGLYNDVAVITLAEDATTTSFVALNADTGHPATSGQTLTAIGFGRTKNGGPTSSTLKKATEQFVTEANCKNAWGCISSSYHICAAYGTEIGVCQGDSGGPLLDLNNVQVGITSFGDASCGSPSDVFASVATYHSWIIGELTSGTCTRSHAPGDTPCSAMCALGGFVLDAITSVMGFLG